MLAAVWFTTRQLYLRAKEDGTLDGIARGLCPFCHQPLCLNGWYDRIFVGLPIRRSFCKRCSISFSFLPCFLAPGKWYSYDDIDDALTFVTDRDKGVSRSARLGDWESVRIGRQESGRRPGPCTRTIERWGSDLGASSAARPWIRWTVAETVRRQPDHPIASELPRGTGLGHRVASLIVALNALGALLIRKFRGLLELADLAAGLWCIESAHTERCFAHPGLAGRLIPSPSPKVSVHTVRPLEYPPASFESKPDS